MHRALQDIRFAVRQLTKNPGFALTTIFTLALGIGATTAIFSLVNAVLLQPLPFPEPNQLVFLERESHTGSVVVQESASYPDFFDWQAQSHSFNTMAAYEDKNMTLLGRGDAQHIDMTVVTPDFFKVLGVKPLLGRVFLPGEERAGSRVVVLSYRLWQSAFASAQDIVGQSINLDGKSYSVVGVMPRNFRFPIENPGPALWRTPAEEAEGDPAQITQRGFASLAVIGRLKPSVTLAQARAEMNQIAGRLALQYPEANQKYTTTFVQSELDHLVGDSRPALRMLFAAVAFLLLVACANVAGLLLARSARRTPEIALRAALGASRLEVLRQILMEALVLSLGGGVAGVVLAAGVLKVIVPLIPQSLPRMDRIALDGWVLAFAVAVSILTGMLFGVLPALRMSRLSPSIALREGGRSVTSGIGQHRLHSVLVVAETAMSLVLLVGSGLLIHSFVRILNVDPGFDPHNLLTARPGLPFNAYPDLKHLQFYDELQRRIAAMPGVQSVAAGYPTPLGGDQIDVSFSIEGQPVAPGAHPDEQLSVVTPGFFQTMRIPILSGRDFRLEDKSQGHPVIIINQSFARKYFPGENPIGKHIQSDLSDGVTKKAMREVVGVVGDVKRQGLTAEAPPQYYLPYSQAIITSPVIFLRSSGSSQGLISAVRSQLNEMDRNVSLYEISTAEGLMSRASAQPRFQTLLVACFAACALLLAAIGLYAVLSFMVVQRTLEIGVRMALGAVPGEIVKMVLRHGLSLALAGLAVGIAISLLVSRLMESMLYAVHPVDVVTYAVVTAVLLVVAFVASSAPAWRAARLDPMETLRSQ